jgi:fatty acid desaturase
MNVEITRKQAMWLAEEKVRQHLHQQRRARALRGLVSVLAIGAVAFGSSRYTISHSLWWLALLSVGAVTSGWMAK